MYPMTTTESPPCEECEIDDILQCPICLNTCQEPHFITCSHGESLNPFCRTCAINWYKHNKKDYDRALSPSGCGCTLNLRSSFDELFKHSRPIERICERFRRPCCQVEGCGMMFTTSEELRRHRTGNLRSTDTFPVCQDSVITCRFCNCNIRRSDYQNHVRDNHFNQIMQSLNSINYQENNNINNIIINPRRNIFNTDNRIDEIINNIIIN